ncbi:MAG: hypothetical protein [Circular genetic element sp.]|nr:MAG: hypothetical protein [Circular genetic element sp.]
MDSNQAGATMASRYLTAKYAAIIGASVFPVGSLARGGSAITGSKAYKAYGVVKRPILSLGVHRQIRGATAAMSLSKAYSKMALTGGILNFGRNVQLARAKEYKRLGINVMGPPLSLFMYDHYMSHNTNAEAEIAAAKQEKSRIDASLTSASKTRGKKLPKFVQPKPKADQICPDGYVFTRKYGAPICELQWTPRK